MELLNILQTFPDIHVQKIQIHPKIVKYNYLKIQRMQNFSTEIVLSKNIINVINFYLYEFY